MKYLKLLIIENCLSIPFSFLLFDGSSVACSSCFVFCFANSHCVLQFAFCDFCLFFALRFYFCIVCYEALFSA